MASGKSPLSVLQVASSLYDWGGIERYVSYLAAGLAARGHEARVACPPGSPLQGRCASPVAISMRWKFDLAGFAAYLRLFRAERFDIVHAHFSPDFVLPAYAARLTKQPRLIMTRHVAVKWNPSKARLYSRLWPTIIPVSRSVERRLLEAGVSQAQLVIAKAGSPEPVVTGTREQARFELGIGSSDFAIGSFGRLAPEKGVDVLIDAVREYPEMQAFLYGDGPQEAELKSRATANIKFMGRVADVGMPMSAMDVIAIPSTWEESFPYAALEAMALGRPLVVSSVGGLPEMVTDRENGRLFPVGDSVALARVLDELHRSPAERESLGAAGRARYERGFTVEHMVDRILGVYLTGRG